MYKSCGWLWVSCKKSEKFVVKNVKSQTVTFPSFLSFDNFDITKKVAIASIVTIHNSTQDDRDSG